MRQATFWQGFRFRREHPGARQGSGHRAADPAIVAAHCRSGETLAGWIAAGTPKGQITPRGEIDPAGILSKF